MHIFFLSGQTEGYIESSLGFFCISSNTPDYSICQGIQKVVNTDKLEMVLSQWKNCETLK